MRETFVSLCAHVPHNADTIRMHASRARMLLELSTLMHYLSLISLSKLLPLAHTI